MQLKQLYYFVQTSQNHSINETAQKLYISQPSLSISLKALETELGFPLFLRSKQGISLTEEGKAILEDCKEILSITNGWNKYSCEYSSNASPVLVKGAGILVSAVMPTLFTALQREYPFMKLSLQQYNNIPIYAVPEPGYNTIVLAQCEKDKSQDIMNTAKCNHWNFKSLYEIPAYIFLNTKNPLCQKEHLYLADILTQKIATFDAVKLKHYPYQSIFSMFSAAQTLHLPTREAALGMIATTPDVIGIFSGLVAINNLYIDNHVLSLRKIDDFPMPILLVAFYSESFPSQIAKRIFEILQQIMSSEKLPKI